MNKAHVLLSLFLLMTSFLMMQVQAQVITANIANARFVCQDGVERIQVTFDKSLHGLIEEIDISIGKAGVDDRARLIDNRAKLIANIGSLGVAGATSPSLYLIRLADGSRTQLRSEDTFKGDNPPDVMTFSTVGPLAVGKDKYGLIVQGVTKEASMSTLSIPDMCRPIADSLPTQTQKKDSRTPNRKFADYVEGVTVKEEANLFADFAFDSRKNTKEDDENYFLTVDASFVPKRFRKLGFGGAYELQPIFLDVKINSGDKNKIYTSEFGSRVKYIRVFGDDGRGYSNNEHKRKILPGITAEAAVKVEMDKWFETANLIAETRGGLPMNLKQSRARTLRIEPYLGFAFGKNVNTVETLDDPDSVRVYRFDKRDWIARPFVGMELTYSEFRDRYLKPSLTVSYIRRWPLVPEVYFLKDGSGQTYAAGSSSLVRDYVKARIDVDLGGFLKPFIAYEWGRNSPGYELINSSFKAGFAVKFRGKDN